MLHAKRKTFSVKGKSLQLTAERLRSTRLTAFSFGL